MQKPPRVIDSMSASRVGCVLALLVMLVVNVLANAVPLGGQTTGEVSARYPSMFTPAGYVFSIWGVIYLLLIGFVIWLLAPDQRQDVQLGKILPVFMLSCFANAAWIFAWHYDHVVLSFVFMLVLLGCLIWIYRKTQQYRASSGLRYWCAGVPFSVYTAWICVAAIANFSAVQLHYDLQDFLMSEPHQTVLKIAFAGAVAVSVLFHRRDVVFVLVVIWAAVGIVVKQADYLQVSGAAGAIALLCALLVCSPWRHRLNGQL